MTPNDVNENKDIDATCDKGKGWVEKSFSQTDKTTYKVDK